MIVYRCFFIFFIIFISQGILFGQADCKILFKYEGEILSDSLQVDSVNLPTTSNLVEYDTLFYTSKVENNRIDQWMLSHLSGAFCGEPEKIIKRVFKRNELEGYLVQIYIHNKIQPMVLIIPIDNVNIKIEKDIIIDLGKIKI